jgi:hypothetical protein
MQVVFSNEFVQVKWSSACEAGTPVTPRPVCYFAVQVQSSAQSMAADVLILRSRCSRVVAVVGAVVGWLVGGPSWWRRAVETVAEAADEMCMTSLPETHLFSGLSLACWLVRLCGQMAKWSYCTMGEYASHQQPGSLPSSFCQLESERPNACLGPIIYLCDTYKTSAWRSLM